MVEAVELRASDVNASFAAAWDRLLAGRGAQADVYDSHAWFASWLSVAQEGTADRVRIAAVMEDGSPIAVLPILQSSSGRRAAIVGMTSRTRARPVIGAEQPAQDVLGLLAETVARSGVRHLNLHRMPSNDPATAGFVTALREAGYRIAQHERSTDNLAFPGSGWEEYARNLKGFARYARRFTNRFESLWSLETDTYGTTSERSVVEGFDVFRRLHHRSWKQGLDAAGRQRRVNLLKRAEERGWARIYVLRIDGVPAAAHIWLRTGDVATWLSTAYDQRLAAFSPGTVIMWQAQSKIFAEENAPRLVDLLPGTTPEKNRLTMSRPPLLVTEAVSPSLWSGSVLPTRRRVTRVVAAVDARLRARLRNAPDSPVHADELTTTAAPERQSRTVRRLNVSAVHRRYIASVNGQPSPEKMAATWAVGDEWWQVGDQPSALIRVNTGVARASAREILRIDGGVEPAAVAVAVASAMGREIVCRNVPVFDAVLPWPQAWAAVETKGGT